MVLKNIGNFINNFVRAINIKFDKKIIVMKHFFSELRTTTIHVKLLHR